MCGVINFRMRNFGQKLKILNVKTETELELASSGIATILGSVLGCLSHYDINVGRIVRLFLLAKCLL